MSAALGFMTGVVTCARFLRHEMLESRLVEPRLKHIEQQLHSLREEINLDAATRLATLSKLLEDRPPPEERDP